MPPLHPVTSAGNQVRSSLTIFTQPDIKMVIRWYQLDFASETKPDDFYEPYQNKRKKPLLVLKYI